MKQTFTLTAQVTASTQQTEPTLEKNPLSQSSPVLQTLSSDRRFTLKELESLLATIEVGRSKERGSISGQGMGTLDYGHSTMAHRAVTMMFNSFDNFLRLLWELRTNRRLLKQCFQ